MNKRRCFCFVDYGSAKSLGNHQWRCTLCNTTNETNTNIHPTITMETTNHMNDMNERNLNHDKSLHACKDVDNNNNIDRMDDLMDDYNTFNINHDFRNGSSAIADKYDTIELLDDSDDESKCSEDDMLMIETHLDGLPEIDINDISNISLTSLLEHQKSVKGEKSPLPANMIAAIELLSLLRASRGSLTLYDKISFWLEKRITHLTTESLPTQDKVIKIMEEWHSFQCVATQKKEVVLPSINLPVEIPVIHYWHVYFLSYLTKI